MLKMFFFPSHFCETVLFAEKMNLHSVMQRKQLTYALDCNSSLFVWRQHFSMHRAPLMPTDVMLLLQFATLSFI